MKRNHEDGLQPICQAKRINAVPTMRNVQTPQNNIENKKAKHNQAQDCNLLQNGNGIKKQVIVQEQNYVQ